MIWYGSRWYDPALGRFLSPDSIVPGVGEGGNPNAIGYVAQANYSPLVVDYHETQFLDQLNKENRERLDDQDFKLPVAPENPLAFDRYAYTFNNPIRYNDPSGHGPTPPAEWMQWLEQNVKIICRSASPEVKNLLFSVNESGSIGTRILMVNHPHQGANYWHINSDLKLLQSINGKNIEPLVGKVASTAAAAKTVATNTLNAVKAYAIDGLATISSVASGETFTPFIIITPGMFDPPYTSEDT